MMERKVLQYQVTDISISGQVSGGPASLTVFRSAVGISAEEFSFVMSLVVHIAIFMLTLVFGLQVL